MTTPRLHGTERTLRVLDAFVEQHDWTLTELARHLDESPSVVHRILLTLLDHRYLAQAYDRGPYSLGPAAARLGRAASQYVVLTRVQRELRQLSERLGETALYYERQGHRYVCRHRTIGRRSIEVTVQLSDTMGLHVGAGRAILAFQPAEFIDEVLEAPLMRYGATSPSTPADVRARLTQCRQRGYARSDGEVTEGTAGLSVPVRDSDGVSRCICVTVEAASLTPAREALIVAELRHASSALAESGDRS